MRLDNPDNNTRSGASSSSTPPLHAEVRAALIEKYMEIAESFYFEGADPETLRKEDAPQFADEVMQAVADALLAGLPDRNAKFGTEHSKPYANGYKDGVDAVTRVIGELGGGTIN